MKGKNDSVKDAEQLACLLKGQLCHVNLIPVNEVQETSFETVSYTHLDVYKRQTNTIGSKAQDIEITGMVVEIKSEIEKIREQIQNIE